MNYADDFVILSRGKAEAAVGVDAWGAGAAGADAERKEDEHPECPAGAIRFSGVYIRAAYQPARTARGTIGYSPSKKSVSRIKQNVGALLDRRNGAPWEEVLSKAEPAAAGLEAVLFLRESRGRRIGRLTNMYTNVYGTF